MMVITLVNVDSWVLLYGGMKISFKEFFEIHCTGEISFLKEHRAIALLIYLREEESTKGNLSKFNEVLKEYKHYIYGGFTWCDSIEGEFFWSDIFESNYTAHFYEKYPRIKTCKLD